MVKMVGIHHCAFLYHKGQGTTIIIMVMAVTKISSCWANTLYNKQAGNQMGSDFFWFYFCSIFV